jgi:hypothetical protein
MINAYSDWNKYNPCVISLNSHDLIHIAHAGYMPTSECCIGIPLAFQGSDGPSAGVEAMTDNPSSPLPSGQAPPPLSLLFF